jgi:hypothetical protein
MNGADAAAGAAPPPSANRAADKAWDWTANYDRWSSWQTQLEQVDTIEKARVQAQRKRDKMEGLKHVSCCSDHSEELRIYEMKPADQLAECDNFKLEGLLFYREGQYFRVRSFWCCCVALVSLPAYPPPSSEDIIVCTARPPASQQLQCKHCNCAPLPCFVPGRLCVCRARRPASSA